MRVLSDSLLISDHLNDGVEDLMVGMALDDTEPVSITESKEKKASLENMMVEGEKGEKRLSKRKFLLCLLHLLSSF